MVAWSRVLLEVTFFLLAVGSIGACSSGATNTASTVPASAGSGESQAEQPSPAASASSAAIPSASLAASSPAIGSPNMRLTSSAFADGAAIPRKYSCDGEDVSPPLAWEGVPTEAKALVLVVDDPDARGFVHWVLFDIPAAPTGRLAEDASATDRSLRQGSNGFGKVGYGGPCPPSGTHHYRFRLLAIREPLGLKGAPTAGTVLTAANDRIVAETTLTGLYHR
jgi:hypothetical protein